MRIRVLTGPHTGTVFDAAGAPADIYTFDALATEDWDWKLETAPTDDPAAILEWGFADMNARFRRAFFNRRPVLFNGHRYEAAGHNDVDSALMRLTAAVQRFRGAIGILSDDAEGIVLGMRLVTRIPGSSAN